MNVHCAPTVGEWAPALWFHITTYITALCAAIRQYAVLRNFEYSRSVLRDREVFGVLSYELTMLD
jgi:hypothetical protein